MNVDLSTSMMIRLAMLEGKQHMYKSSETVCSLSSWSIFPSK
jgi:hypothetical protein